VQVVNHNMDLLKYMNAKINMKLINVHAGRFSILKIWNVILVYRVKTKHIK